MYPFGFITVLYLLDVYEEVFEPLVNAIWTYKCFINFLINYFVLGLCLDLCKENASIF